MVLHHLVAGLLSLGCVKVIVGIVAYHLLPDRWSYKSAQTEKFVYGRALANFGVNTALACHAFKSWDHREAERRLTSSELAAVFEGPFDRDTAMKFAETVIEVAWGEDATHFLA